MRARSPPPSSLPRPSPASPTSCGHTGARARSSCGSASTSAVASTHVDDAGARPAALVEAPLPHFPDELRAHWTESEVVVRFRVDERGRVDVGSMKVLKSDHDLFVAAVRAVLPRFRFEPARSAAPESKPVADWVDFRVKFAATH